MTIKFYGVMRIKITTLLLSIILSCINSSASTNSSPTLAGKYFSQIPPGMTASLFAPGIISTRYHEHSSPVYSPDGNEIFYTLSHESGHALMYMKMENGIWSIPIIAVFSGEFSDDKAHFSADGKRLYFRSKRPIDSLTKQDREPSDLKYRDWYVNNIKGKWEKVATLNLSGNKEQTLSGTVYFDKLSDENNPYTNDIYYRTLLDGKYSKPIKLSNNINSGGLEYFGYIAPDESYLMIYAYNRPDMADGTMAIYISFKKSDGKWSKSINMGEAINYDGGSSRFPNVSPDGKYLFFNGQKFNGVPSSDLTAVEESIVKNKPTHIDGGTGGDMYWISSEIIEKLRREK